MRRPVDCCWVLLDEFFLLPSRTYTHPSIRTLDERLVRSVQVGGSRNAGACSGAVTTVTAAMPGF